MENFKRSVKRLITRLTVLGLVVICGAIAIAHANKDRNVANAADQGSDGIAFTDANLTDSARESVISAAQAVRDTAARVKTAADDVDLSRDLSSWGEQPSAAEQEVETTPVDFRAAEPTEDLFTPSQRYSDRNVVPVQALQDASQDPPFSAPNLPAGGQGTAASRFTQPAGDVATEDAPPLIREGETRFQGGGLPELKTQDTSFPFQANDSSPSANAQQQPAGLRKFNAASQSQGNEPFINDSRYSNAPVTAGQDTTTAPEQPPRFGQQPRSAAQNPMRGVTALNSNADRNFAAPAPNFDAPASDYRNSAAATTVEPVQSVEPPPANSFARPAPTVDRQPTADVYGTAASEYSTEGMSGAGKPGPSEQEGPQHTGLTIHKIAPKDVRVGQDATFEIKVRNNSQVPAENVLIRDEIPVGTQLVDTNPQATQGANGGLLWEVGTLRPNEDTVVRMKVKPLQEGVVGSTASVTYQALASARAKVTRPALKITHSTKEKVLIGDAVRFAITIENPGSGPATNVIVEEDVPAGLSHSKGPRLEYEVGTIPPGGRRRLELSLKAAREGMVENMITARGGGDLVAHHSLQLQVIAPQLQVKIKGPSKRYLERKATYTVAIENPGSADAQNVEIATQLPRGLKFVSTNNNGRYDASTNTIRWTLARLPARQFGEVQFTAIPVAKGDFNLAASAKADKDLSDSKNHPLVVEGLAALLFEVKDRVDPIEVGSETTYEIRVENQGTEDASNVQFVASIPPGMRPVSAQGPTNYKIQGNKIVFDAISRLPAKRESNYTVRVEGVQANDHRFKVEMFSDSMSTPVVEEESTRVYAD